MEYLDEARATARTCPVGELVERLLYPARFRAERRAQTPGADESSTAGSTICAMARAHAVSALMQWRLGPQEPALPMAREAARLDPLWRPLHALLAALLTHREGEAPEAELPARWASAIFDPRRPLSERRGMVRSAAQRGLVTPAEAEEILTLIPRGPLARRNGRWEPL
jgi:hypothetical protein